MRVFVLQSNPAFPDRSELNRHFRLPPPKARIMQGDPGWDEAYKRWTSGKAPTDDPAWREGVFAAYCDVIIPQKVIIISDLSPAVEKLLHTLHEKALSMESLCTQLNLSEKEVVSLTNTAQDHGWVDMWFPLTPDGREKYFRLTIDGKRKCGFVR